MAPPLTDRRCPLSSEPPKPRFRRDVSPAHGGTSPRPPASPKVHENSRVSAALRTVYSSLQALQRHKSNVSSPATGSPASSTASPPSSTAALTASTNVVTSNLAGTANTTAGNFSTPGAAVKDALWMHKRNEHLESEVSPAGSDCVCWGDSRETLGGGECGRHVQRGASCARCSACVALVMVVVKGPSQV